jgi:hypothetical protein
MDCTHKSLESESPLERSSQPRGRVQSHPSQRETYPSSKVPHQANQQTDFLICHLIQEQGQKKSLDAIKASLKQAVHVPSNFVSLGTQLQLLQWHQASSLAIKATALTTSNISYSSSEERKKNRDQIPLNKFFAAKCHSAIDRRFQRWL